MTERLRTAVASAAVASAALVLWACADGSTPTNSAARPAADESGETVGQTEADASASAFKLRRYVRNTPQAVGLAFDRSGRMVYAEKDSGRIVRFSKGRKRVLARLGVASGGEAGLLGLAVDASDRFYAYYTGPASGCPNPTRSSPRGGVSAHCVWRLRRSGARLVADRRVFSAGHPSSAENHVGGGLHFGPDGALYLSIGDLGENDDPRSGPDRAQDLGVPFGKLLRLDPDGDNKAAAGNPDRCGNKDNSAQRRIEDERIFACGLRNTYQFAFDSRGVIWGAESGDSCDEINRISAGVNYGWAPPRTDCAGTGAGRPTIKLRGTPSGIAVPTGRRLGRLRDDVFYCVFDGNRLMRYDRPAKRLRQVRQAAGRCGYDLVSRGKALYMSSGEHIYRLSLTR